MADETAMPITLEYCIKKTLDLVDEIVNLVFFLLLFTSDVLLLKSWAQVFRRKVSVDFVNKQNRFNRFKIAVILNTCT